MQIFGPPKSINEKVACVYDDGYSVELAIQLSKSFKKVLYYVPWKSTKPIVNDYFIGYNIPNIERIDNIFEHIEEVDIFIFSTIYNGDLQVFLEDKCGKLVSGSRKAEILEIDRVFSKKLLKQLDLPVTNYEVIKGTEELHKYLQENKDVYVKINGKFRTLFETFHSNEYLLTELKIDEIEGNLGAVGDEFEFIVEEAIPDSVEVGLELISVNGNYSKKNMVGIEVKNKGYIGRIMDRCDIPEEITIITDKLAPIFKAYGYKGPYSDEIRVTKDHKSYMLDFCCFDKETEILTDSGWKLFSDLNKKEKVATLNNKGFIEFQKPTDYISYNYNDDMILISNNNKTIECLVTKNHDVLRYNRDKTKLFKEKANSLTDCGYIPRTGKWKGENVEYFILQKYENDWYSGKHNKIHKKIVLPELQIKMKDWVAFMGIYLSEGSKSDRKYGINISQKNHIKEFEIILNKLPFKYTYKNGNFHIHSIQLNHYLSQFGLCYDKYVPDYIKELTPELISIFLDAYILGDGTIKDYRRSIKTTSKKMADDLQELFLKIGSLSNITIQDNIGGDVFGYKRKHLIYSIRENIKEQDFYFSTKPSDGDYYIKTISYNDNVYCVTVPNGTLYVRKNGKPFWSGNCREPIPPGYLRQYMYKNYAEMLYGAAKGQVIEPEYDYEYGCELILDSRTNEKNFVPVIVPDKYKNNVKLNRFMIHNEVPYIIPNGFLGSVLFSAPTLEEAIDGVKEVAESIQCPDIEFDFFALERAKEQVEKLENYNINFFNSKT